MIVLSKLLNKNHLSELAYNNKKGSCNTCRSLFRTFISFSIFFLSFLSFFYFSFSIFFSSFSNLLRYISPAMVRPNGKANQMPRMPKPQGNPRV